MLPVVYYPMQLAVSHPQTGVVFCLASLVGGGMVNPPDIAATMASLMTVCMAVEEHAVSANILSTNTIAGNADSVVTIYCFLVPRERADISGTLDSR